MDDNNEKALEEIENENVDALRKSTYNFNLMSLKADIYGKRANEEAFVKVKEIYSQLISLNPGREETYIDAYNKLVDTDYALPLLMKQLNNFLMIVHCII